MKQINMMKHQRFLQAMAAAMGGGTVDWTEALPWEDWAELFRMARSHHVLPLVFEAVYACPAARLADAEKMRAVKLETIRAVSAQTVKTHGLLGLLEFLRERGLEPLVVKGLLCRDLYPMPDHRISTDEDLLIPPEQFEDCCRALTEFGMVRAGTAGSYEIPFRMPGSPLYIELHRSLFPPESDAYGDLNRFFRRVHERAITVTAEGARVRTMEEGDHLFYLILHAFKHFLHSGFGIRQVCDILVFARQCRGRIDWWELYEKCCAVRADRFAAAMFQIGREHFGFDLGLPACWRPRGLDAAPLLEDLLEAGVYGYSTLSRRHSASITIHAVAAEKRGRPTGSGLLRSLFPPRADLEDRYPWLRKQPWLLPLAWGQRILRYHASTGGPDNDPAAAMAIGRERIALLQYYGVIPGKEARHE